MASRTGAGEPLPRLYTRAGAGEIDDSRPSHVGTTPRAVNGEEPQAGRRNTEQVRVAVRHQLVRPLRGVQVDRMVGDAGIAEGNVPVQPIHRDGGSVDQMSNRMLSCRLQHAQKAVNVAGGVGAT